MANKGRSNKGFGCGALFSIAFLLAVLGALFIFAVSAGNAHGFDVLGFWGKVGNWMAKNADMNGINKVKFSDPNSSSAKNAINDAQNKAKNGIDNVDKNENSIPSKNKNSINYGKTTDKEPSESLASSVLDENVKVQLGNKITYDGHGSFYVNDNQSTLDIPKGSPFLKSGTLNNLGQLTASTAILNNSMSAKRVTNKINWEPLGYKQMKIDAPAYGNYLYNKGHSIGAALSSGWSGIDVSYSLPIYATQKGEWNASEYYADNVTTQTSWAKQAIDGQYGTSGYGQNYFEDIVRKEQVSYKVSLIAYSVKPVYEGMDKIPVGNQIQAKSNDGRVNLNVFIPNVQMGVVINYQTGDAKIAN